MNAKEIRTALMEAEADKENPALGYFLTTISQDDFIHRSVRKEWLSRFLALPLEKKREVGSRIADGIRDVFEADHFGDCFWNEICWHDGTSQWDDAVGPNPDEPSGLHEVRKKLMDMGFNEYNQEGFEDKFGLVFSQKAFGSHVRLDFNLWPDIVVSVERGQSRASSVRQSLKDALDWLYHELHQGIMEACHD